MILLSNKLQKRLIYGLIFVAVLLLFCCAYLHFIGLHFILCKRFINVEYLTKNNKINFSTMKVQLHRGIVLQDLTWLKKDNDSEIYLKTTKLVLDIDKTKLLRGIIKINKLILPAQEWHIFIKSGEHEKEINIPIAQGEIATSYANNIRIEKPLLITLDGINIRIKGNYKLQKKVENLSSLSHYLHYINESYQKLKQWKSAYFNPKNKPVYIDINFQYKQQKLLVDYQLYSDKIIYRDYVVRQLLIQGNVNDQGIRLKKLSFYDQQGMTEVIGNGYLNKKWHLMVTSHCDAIHVIQMIPAWQKMLNVNSMPQGIKLKAKFYGDDIFATNATNFNGIGNLHIPKITSKKFKEATLSTEFSIKEKQVFLQDVIFNSKPLKAQLNLLYRDKLLHVKGKINYCDRENNCYQTNITGKFDPQWQDTNLKGNVTINYNKNSPQAVSFETKFHCLKQQIVLTNSTLVSKNYLWQRIKKIDQIKVNLLSAENIKQFYYKIITDNNKQKLVSSPIHVTLKKIKLAKETVERADFKIDYYHPKKVLFNDIDLFWLAKNQPQKQKQLTNYFCKIKQVAMLGTDYFVVTGVRGRSWLDSPFKLFLLNSVVRVFEQTSFQKPPYVVAKKFTARRNRKKIWSIQGDITLSDFTYNGIYAKRISSQLDIKSKRKQTDIFFNNTKLQLNHQKRLGTVRAKRLALTKKGQLLTIENLTGKAYLQDFLTICTPILENALDVVNFTGSQNFTADGKLYFPSSKLSDKQYQQQLLQNNLRGRFSTRHVGKYLMDNRYITFQTLSTNYGYQNGFVTLKNIKANSVAGKGNINADATVNVSSANKKQSFIRATASLQRWPMQDTSFVKEVKNQQIPRDAFMQAKINVNVPKEGSSAQVGGNLYLANFSFYDVSFLRVIAIPAVLLHKVLGLDKLAIEIIHSLQTNFSYRDPIVTFSNINLYSDHAHIQGEGKLNTETEILSIDVQLKKAKILPGVIPLLSEIISPILGAAIPIKRDINLKELNKSK